MQKLGLFISALATMLFCILGAPVLAAENEDVPSKESFIAAWEVQQRKLPTTLLLEKKADNVYLYETTIFPFKGELKILNVVIDKEIRYYADYDLNYEDIVRGVLEYELVGLPREDIHEKYPHSFSLWDSHNYLFFSDETKRWLNPKEMGEVVDLREAREEREENEAKAQCPAPKKDNESDLLNAKILISLAPSFLLFLIFGSLSIYSLNVQRKYLNRTNEINNQYIVKQDQANALHKEAVSLLKQLSEKK